MELVDVKYKIRCDMGSCGKMAVKTIRMNRVGVKSQIHICKDCLKELYRVVSTEKEQRTNNKVEK